MSVILNAPRLWSESKRYINRNENKEEYDMCQAMRGFCMTILDLIKKCPY